MQTQTFKLLGLTCPACKKIAEKRIATISGVTKVEVTVVSGIAVVESNKNITKLQIRDVLKDTPYQVV